MKKYLVMEPTKAEKTTYAFYINSDNKNENKMALAVKPTHSLAILYESLFWVDYMISLWEWNLETLHE